MTSPSRTLVLLGLSDPSADSIASPWMFYRAGPKSSGVPTWELGVAPIDNDPASGWRILACERRHVLKRVASWTYGPSGLSTPPTATKPFGPASAAAAFASLDEAARAAVSRYPRDRLGRIANAIDRAKRHLASLENERDRLVPVYDPSR